MLRCELCSVDVPDAVAFGFHVAGKKHQRNEKIQMYNDAAERSIFVTPLPQYTSRAELIEFFLQFGNIRSYSFRPYNVIFEFEKKESVDLLLHKAIWFKNTKLNIRRKLISKRSEEQTNSPKSTYCLRYENIMHIFDENSTFESQLSAFLKTILLSDSEIELRYKAVIGHLDRVFRPIFPNYKIYNFGSTQTGMGFKESDFDFYIDIGEAVYDGNDEQQTGWTTQKIFREVKRAMYRMNAIFSYIIPIPRAKIPIIKFRYVPTNMACDISFKSGLGVYNSEFIRFALSLDVRLKPLMIIVKYWARHIEVSGTGKISNYALVMLVLFYLQQPSVNIFPRICDFQRLCTPILINGWQVNFDRRAVIPPALTNDSTVPQLLEGFFNFYANFEYKGNVICPIDGQTYNDQLFKTVKELPHSMERYKYNVNSDEACPKLPVGKPISVQDPFELNCNITTMTSSRILDSFQKNCATAAAVCEIESEEGNKNLFKALFAACVKKEQKREAFVLLPCKSFVDVNLPEDFATRTDIADKDAYKIDNWFCTTFRIVRDAFEKVMRLQVEILSVDNEKKQQKINVLSDVHTIGHERIMMRLTGNDGVWYGRRSSQVILDPSMSCLEKEIAVTDRALRSAYAQKIRLDFLCRFDKKTNPLAISLSLSDKNCQKNSFKQVVEFVKTKIPKIVDRTFIHLRQYNKRY